MEEKLREAIFMDGFNDPRSSPRSSYHTAIDDAVTLLTEDGELGRSSPKEEVEDTPTGEPSQSNTVCSDDDEELEHYRAISRYFSRSAGAENTIKAESSQTTVIDIRRDKDTSEPPDWPLKSDKGKGLFYPNEGCSRQLRVPYTNRQRYFFTQEKRSYLSDFPGSPRVENPSTHIPAANLAADLAAGASTRTKTLTTTTTTSSTASRKPSRSATPPSN